MQCIKGLRILLNTIQKEYMDFTTESGFVVTIHDIGIPAFPIDFGMNIPASYISSIAIQKVKEYLKKLNKSDF